MAAENPDGDDRRLVDIRLLGEDDWALARAARLAALRDAPQFFLPRQPAEESWTDGHWRRSCTTGMWAVARTGDTIVGLAQLTRGGIGPHLESVWTHPDHRRRGIASNLVRRLVERERDRGSGDVYVWVIVPNPAAVALYVALGFRPTGERQLLGGLGRYEERLRLSGELREQR
jgi:ribosomal protein S18 acetylase RimI-like enzyme